MTLETDCETQQQKGEQERWSSLVVLNDFKSLKLSCEEPKRNQEMTVQRSPVADVIEFEALEDPPWRVERREYPTVKEMIANIVEFQKMSTTKEHNIKALKKIREKIIHKYVYQVNAEEEHGVGTLEKTVECIETFQLEGEQRASSTEEAAASSEDDMKRQETINVFKAYKWLEQKVTEECEEDKSLYGFLESSIVKDLHKIIMDKLPVPPGHTKPGECSNNIRLTEFKGELYEYQKPDDMEEEMNKLLDRFNSLINWSKSIRDGEERMLKILKATSWLLFELLDLHPFSDGNGRLCRLLSSYALSVYNNPFPTPIYNIWSESSKEDYVNALCDARKSSDRHPKALTTMIIECSWFTWQDYIRELDIINTDGIQME